MTAFLGIDVAKDTLAVALLGSKSPRKTSLPNTPAGGSVRTERNGWRWRLSSGSVTQIAAKGGIFYALSALCDDHYNGTAQANHAGLSNLPLFDLPSALQ
jgi:hypothetical protein